MARPTLYDPAMCDNKMPGHGSVVVYALCDEAGVPFYIGKSVNFPKRLQAYKAAKSHGNMILGQQLAKWGGNPRWAILEENPEDVNVAEYEWINCIPNLCNIMLKPFYAKSPKPWVISGSKCPSAQVRQHVKRNVKGNVDWVKGYADSLSDENRLEFECKVAVSCLHTDLGQSLQKWIDGAIQKGSIAIKELENASA